MGIGCTAVIEGENRPGSWSVLWEGFIVRGMHVYCALGYANGGMEREEPTYVEPVVVARGLPEDLSYFARETLDGTSRHSWLTAGELREAWRRASASQPGANYDAIPKGVWDTLDANEGRGRSVRFVFGFD